ncbi:MAG: hypothetical protein R6W68_03790 [Ignavibacteriaceae bacterium]
MQTIDEVLKNNKNGMYYGNRVLLPFQCHILKIVIENDIITDFSIRNKGAYINEYPEFTEIYFLEYPEIEENISKFENIKMIIVEKGKDIFNPDEHKKIALHPEGNHILSIKKLDENTIFID